MTAHAETDCAAFEGFCLIVSGKLAQVATETKNVIARGERAQILIFDNATGEQVEVDFRGTASDVVGRLAAPPEVIPPEAETSDSPSTAPRGPGRPKLGVVAHEVTLLPSHWEWLRSQPGGASVVLRKLVTEARRRSAGQDKIRAAQESTYRFLSAIAGNFVAFEEATRALFAGSASRFEELTETWPKAIRDHARKMAADAFAAELDSTTKPLA